MVHYIKNLDLFEDYPRALEDEEYDAEDVFASYKRYSVPHIDDIIFRMSYDPDFYAMLDPQSTITLEDSGECDCTVKTDARSTLYDYPQESAEIVDDDWYPPHPGLDAVLAGVANLQLEASHTRAGGRDGHVRLTTPDVPIDARAFQTINVCPKQNREREKGLQQTGDEGTWVKQHFDVRLSLIIPTEALHETPVKKSEEEPFYPKIPDTPKHPEG